VHLSTNTRQHRLGNKKGASCEPPFPIYSTQLRRNLQAGVSQPVETEIGPAGRVVGTITLRTIGGITAGARYYDARIDRISRVVTRIVTVGIRIVVAVIVGVGIGAVAKRTTHRQSRDEPGPAAKTPVAIAVAEFTAVEAAGTVLCKLALSHLALGKLRASTAGSELLTAATANELLIATSAKLVFAWAPRKAAAPPVPLTRAAFPMPPLRTPAFPCTRWAKAGVATAKVSDRAVAPSKPSLDIAFLHNRYGSKHRPEAIVPMFRAFSKL
jgi:hypothetical protein